MSLLAVVAVVLMASTATKTFAQTSTVVTSHHVLSAGDPGGGAPDPTGGPGPY
jgi:hypothetical protein